jgi:hypothetical protein
MSTEQFDDLVRKKLGELDFEANDMQWAKLQRQLEQRTVAATEQVGGDEGGAVLPWYSKLNAKRIAATVAALLAVGALALMLSKKGEAPGQDTLVNTTPANTTTEQQAAPTNDATTNTDIAGNTTIANDNNTTPNQTNSSAGAQASQNTTAPTPYKAAGPGVHVGLARAVPQQTIEAPSNNSTVENISPTPNANNNNVGIATNDNIAPKQDNLAPQAPQSPKPKATDNISIANNTPKQTPQVNMPINMPTPAPSKASQATKNYMLNLATSAGIGRQNQSMLVFGMSAQKNIASNVYVETALNFSNNNAGTVAALNSSDFSVASANKSTDMPFNATNVPEDIQTVTAGTQDLFNRAGGFRSDAQVATAIAQLTPAYNIEFLPTIGFRINKTFKLATGVDFSQAVLGQTVAEELSYLQSNASTPVAVRGWDAGANARAEANITKRISIGYRYRAGLTQVTPGSGINSRRNFHNLGLKMRLR